MAAVGGEDRETELELLALTPGPPWKANSAFEQFVTSSRPNFRFTSFAVRFSCCAAARTSDRSWEVYVPARA